MPLSVSLNHRALACAAAVAALQSSAWGQATTPNAGTIEQQRQQQLEPQLPTLPAPGGADITSTLPVRPAYMGPDVTVTPAGFRFIGNSVLSEAELQAVVAGAKGKEMKVSDLVNLADKVRQTYAAKGYVLTSVYVPEQSFAAQGGIVEFAVAEARIGRVKVTVAPGSGITQAYAESLAQTYLRSGDLITQYGLDKPVLLLRDLPDCEAAATVSPGDRTGEADVLIAITPREAKKYHPYVSLDNMGEQSAGPNRLAAGITWDAPFGIGDVFTARVQAANRGGNELYRLSYGAPVGPYGTKLTASYTESDYALGDQFAALDASGRAGVSSVLAVQPLIRGRFTNLFLTAGVDFKLLQDDVKAVDGASGTKQDNLVHIGVLGNHSDGFLGDGTTSFSASVSGGHLRLDAALQALDAGNPSSSGAHTAGDFAKGNIDVERVQFLNDRSSLLLSMTGQYATKNLTSAEKMDLGGPQGVRGYPIGEGVGDQGVQGTAEYRYKTGVRFMDEGLSLTAFYDVGTVQYDHTRNSGTLSTTTGPNHLTLDSVGVGLLLGREDNYVVTASVSSRVGGPPATAASDSHARAWLLLQKWF